MCRGEDSQEEPYAMFEEAEEVGPPAMTRRSPARALPLIQEEATLDDEEMLDAEPGAAPAISTSIKTALRSSSRLAASIARSVTGSQKPGDEDDKDGVFPPSSSLLHLIHCCQARTGTAAVIYVFSTEPNSTLFSQIHEAGMALCQCGCVTGIVSCRWRGELSGTGQDCAQDPLCVGAQVDGSAGARGQRFRSCAVANQDDNISPEQQAPAGCTVI